MMLTVLSFGPFQPRFDQFDLVLGRRDALPGFLLERMKHIDHACESDRIDRATGVAVIVVDDFQNAAAT
jgi:hypothetical protein